jgi:hypothetical protein
MAYIHKLKQELPLELEYSQPGPIHSQASALDLAEEDANGKILV